MSLPYRFFGLVGITGLTVVSILYRGMRTVAPEEETRCTETDAEDGRSETLDDDVISDLIQKLTEAGVSCPTPVLWYPSNYSHLLLPCS